MSVILKKAFYNFLSSEIKEACGDVSHVPVTFRAMSASCPSVPARPISAHCPATEHVVETVNSLGTWEWLLLGATEPGQGSPGAGTCPQAGTRSTVTITRENSGPQRQDSKGSEGTQDIEKGTAITWNPTAASQPCWAHCYLFSLSFWPGYILRAPQMKDTTLFITKRRKIYITKSI